MKSPKDMRIIQIDVTNACVFQCSNCTRFCGHHKRNFFMSFDCFKEAVDSLEGYVGTVGIMGGEPTLNPDFEKMAEYLASKKPRKVTDIMLRPQRHFMDSIHDLEFEHTFYYSCDDGKRQTVDGPGLWATTKAFYKKYYETIQDTIQYQALNDHSRPMWHQPALISRKALGISDEEWIPMRNNCWLQNQWSASITPKGAFFCEVAASLDMLFDGPGGWKVEKDWWKRTPDDFEDQLHWCELCGLACNTFMRNANEQVYDVSDDIYEKLKKSGSRLLGTNHINIVEIYNGEIAEQSKAEGKRFGDSMPYTESYSARYDEENTDLTYKEIFGIVICKSRGLLECAFENLSKFEKSYLIAPSMVLEDIQKKVTSDSKLKIDVKYRTLEKHSLGMVLDEELADAYQDRYALIIDGGVRIRDVLNDMNSVVLNPGTLLYSELNENEENSYFSCFDSGSVALLSGIAKSYRNMDKETLFQIRELKQIADAWKQDRVFPFHPDTVYTAPTVNITSEKKYVIYGAGRYLNRSIEKIRNGGGSIIAVVDSDKSKWGTMRYEYEIQSPSAVLSYKDKFDYVMIGSFLFYKEIKKDLISMGISESRMAWV